MNRTLNIIRTLVLLVTASLFGCSGSGNLHGTVDFSSSDEGGVLQINLTDSPLDLFKQLAREATFPFVQRIRKERNHLDSEDLYWVGFHLAEGAGEEKSLGAELLRMVAEKEGKSKLGRNARNKLRLEGLKE